MQPGPVIGVVQSDIPMTGGIEHGFDSHLFLQEMLALSDQSAASRPPPQLIVWPEAMPAVPPLNREWLQAPNPDAALLVASQEFERALRDWTTRTGIPLLVGTEAVVPQRDNPKAAELSIPRSGSIRGWARMRSARTNSAFSRSAKPFPSAAPLSTRCWNNRSLRTAAFPRAPGSRGASSGTSSSFLRQPRRARRYTTPSRCASSFATPKAAARFCKTRAAARPRIFL